MERIFDLLIKRVTQMIIFITILAMGIWVYKLTDSFGYGAFASFCTLIIASFVFSDGDSE